MEWHWDDMDWSWKDLLSRLEITKTKGKRLPKPTLQQLDSLETALGMKLPLSYRRFAKIFGAGELANFYRIYIPQSGRSKGAQSCDIQGENRRLRKIEHWKNSYVEDPEQAASLVFFGSSVDGDLFGWSTADVRMKKYHEYGIYTIERAENTVTNVAPTFPDFVKDCLKLCWSFMPY